MARTILINFNEVLTCFFSFIFLVSKRVVMKRDSISFPKNKSYLENLSKIVDQIIDYIGEQQQQGNNRFLETEGLLRISGNVNDVQNVFTLMIKDPILYPLSSKENVGFLRDPHNLMALLKLALRSCKAESNLKNIFEEFIDESKTEAKVMRCDRLIEKLENNKGFLEARIIYNIIYLCQHVLKKCNKNKMNSNALAIAFAPTFDQFLNVLAGKNIENAMAFSFFDADLLKSARIQSDEIKNKFQSMLENEEQKRVFSKKYGNNTSRANLKISLISWLSPIFKGIIRMLNALVAMFTFKRDAKHKKEKGPAINKNSLSSDTLLKTQKLTPFCASVTPQYKRAKASHVTWGISVKSEENQSTKKTPGSIKARITKGFIKAGCLFKKTKGK